MIRVNLLKSKVANQKENFEEANLGSMAFGGTGGGGGGNVDQTAAAINIVIMIIFIVPIYLYSQTLVNAAKESYDRTVIEAQDVATRLSQKTAEKARLGNIETELKELQGKLDLLKKLTRIRVRELKALDYLQTMIPDRVWLRAIDYKDEKIKFEGFAVADDDLTEFLRRLEDRNFFTNVILTQATEAKTPEGTVRSFEINANMETN